MADIISYGLVGILFFIGVPSIIYVFTKNNFGGGIYNEKKDEKL